MMGSLGGMPERDGVDTGGHFWIPDGIASNCEDLEAQYPLMVLSRRHLDAGADGAGRHRGGLGFSETTTVRGALACQIVLHTNESFTKGQGLLGANPGTRAWLRLKHGTDLADRLATGTVPGGVDDVRGDEELVPFKGAPLTVADGDVWEWVSPTTGGYGDPLRREPAAVEEDVAAGRLAPDDAKRVYGVVPGDPDATRQLRLALRRGRLDGRDPGDPVAPPDGARRVGELLHVVDGRWWCNGADLGSASGNYRDACVVRECKAREISREFDAADVEMADAIVFREYLCPVTGFRIDAELARAGEPVLHDIRLAC
jgi:N-methylhydantoinase B